MKLIRTLLIPLTTALLLAACAHGQSGVRVGTTPMHSVDGRHFIGVAISP